MSKEKEVMTDAQLKKSIRSLKKLADMMGSYYQISKALGIAGQNVYGWVKGTRYIPPKHLIQLCRLSGHTLQMKDFRPDLDL